MPVSSANSDSCGSRRGEFVSTNWSVVVAAGGSGPQARLALEELCTSYWYPLYAFLRRQGARSHDAEDRVQSFFSWLMEKGCLGYADQQRGLFRSFLLTALKQFLARHAEHEAAAKRQPARPLLSLEATSGAQRYRDEPFHELTPECQYDYSWAMALVQRAMQRLRSEWTDDGKLARFEVLKECLTGRHDTSGRRMAGQLGLSEGCVRVAIHRLKQRYGEILREEVGQTLESAADVEAELAHLIDALHPAGGAAHVCQ